MQTVRPAPEVIAVGANLLRLVSTWPSWVKRRVETIEFVDEATIRRDVRVDLDLSDHLADDVRVAWKGMLLVPIAALKRQPHATFVVDEQSTMLPRINKWDERQLCFAAMLGWAEELTSRKGLRLPPTFAGGLQTIISTEHSRAAAATFLSGDDPQSRLLRESENGAFRTALEDLTENFYLLAPLSTSSDALRVLRYCYTETLQTKNESSGRARALWDFVLLTDSQYEIAVPSVGDCQSYHLEVHAPWDLTFMKAEIVVRRGGRHVEPERQPVDDWHPSRAHIFVAIGDAVSEGTATIQMRPMPTGLVRSTFLSAAFSATILLGCTAVLFSQRFGWTSGDLRGDPSALTLVLLIPGVVTAYLSTPAKHRLTSRILFNVRLSAVIAALMAFVVAATVALDWEPSSQLWVVPLATLVALAFAVRLAAQYLRASRGMKDLRRAVHEARVEKETHGRVH